MARPIPRTLLSDSVSYQAKSGEGSRGPVYSSAVTIKYVLIQRKNVRFLDQNGYEKIGKGIMIYDYKNSSPANIDFKLRDKITDIRTNELYHIAGYTEQPTLQGQHHIELILV